jgi:uncharacterized membrane protein YagU involved in acid resistance
METKIPPPVVTLIFGFATYLSRKIFPEIEIQYSSFFGIFLLLLGFFILISAVKLFRNDKTTVKSLESRTSNKISDKWNF